MMLGAILTQATQWGNVEQAIGRLRQAGLLSPRRLLEAPRLRLERLVRPAGYFRQKAKRIYEFTRWYVSRYQGSSALMFRVAWPILRRELLALHGIGPESADSILLYGGAKAVFVVDAYTKRVFFRHGLISQSASYGEVQARVMRELRAEAADYNEFHALLVALGKRFCFRRMPACAHCPLGDLPHTRAAC
jgi:endonuclease-3 related protein